MDYDIAVIGGGPGGYVAAIRAAQLGGRVLLIEKEKIGGACLNRGCIPTKTLLKSAEKWEDLKHCAEFGLRADNIGFDFSVVTARKNKVVAGLRGGIEQLVKSNDITFVQGAAALTGPRHLEISTSRGQENFEVNKIIIATGSVPGSIPVPGHALPAVLTSDELLELTEVPKSLLVIGAGVVGMEFSAVMRAFGCEITVVEMLPNILPMVDSDIVKRLGLSLRKKGINILASAQVTGIEEAAGGVVVKVDTGKDLREFAVEKVLVSAGRRPVTTGLGLETAGVEYDRTGIKVNEHLETTIPGIYAIGDVTGKSMLAHTAAAAGVVAAENAMGLHAVMDYRAIPACIFTTPEIAVVGLTEEEAKAQAIAIVSGKFNFAANGKAVTMGETDGLVKIIAEKDTRKIIGMHIMGPHASDLIMEGALAIRNGLTAEAIAQTIHPHPTLSETVMESAHGILGDMIHQIKMKSRK
ncbi:dihydrolipoyl dehydrogenase [Sporomusa acidovorans]|uniref:Dihydrolipoyl dehydrogenase n=1 Tax=Sporomusa acidovorans (strain ATCC 49682 / DSM 3132 / Mol) TaxID=1123286 RepID=A0ABZ3JAW3_SPOA4|nr:dihydrolipoyl dehydrogenase [Sporomusa acidovorans]OZC21684.1 dihydrolipoyl dehydrogenase [Sporomusa acidovorans DSM 3132]SDD60186.1 dihydrolipoamide dehydrogenase [Sporomusa acidovorans]